MKMAIFKDKKSKNSSRLNIHFGKIILIMLVVLGQVLVVGNNEVEASETLYYYDVKMYDQYGGLSKNHNSSIDPPGTYYVGRDGLRRKLYSEGWEINNISLDVKASKILTDSQGNTIYYYSFLQRNEYGKSEYDMKVFAYSPYSKTSVYQGDYYDNFEGYSYEVKKVFAYIQTYHFWETGTPPAGPRGVIRTIENVILPSNYPVNGIHTDGLWYVRKGPVNQAPTITVISPSGNSYFSKVNQAQWL